MLASIPSPSSELIPVIGVRYYGVMIALGVLAGVMLARARWKAAGHDPDEISDIAVWAVPAGLIGSRLYHVITDFNLYDDAPWYWPLEIWKGGLGIPGGIAGGILGGLWAAKHYKIDIPTCADAMIPGIPLAQAIGRLGNWFNQEVFGRPTDLPWALEIDPENRPPRYADEPTFHPTFAYEALWNLSLMGVLLWIDRKKILRPGKIMPLYVTGYFLGRLWVEALRSDHANTIAGLRVNTWLSMIMIVVGALWFVAGGALRPETERGIHPEPWAGPPPEGADGDVAPAGDDSAGVLGEDGVAERGPEVEGPGAEVPVAQGDQSEPGDGVDPDERP